MKSICVRYFVALSLLLGASGCWATNLEAQTNRHSIGVNESLTLSLRYQGQTLEEPDFTPIEKDFDILSTQRQSQFSFGGGQGSSYTEWILSLMPKRSGPLTIPALHLTGETSKPIEIVVVETEPTANPGSQVFIEASLDTNEAYIHSQVILTLKLHTSVMLRNLDFKEPTLANARVVKLDDSQYQKTINGREYIVVEFKYALFAEEAGELTIPSLNFNAVIPERNDPFNSSLFFNRRGQVVRLNSEELSLNVLPIPDGISAGDWIPAQGLSLSQRWSRPPDQLRVGEPITRTITMTAQGLTGAQLPPLDTGESDHYKQYPDQPEITETLSPSGVLGSRQESTALVATSPGELRLPAIKVQWWDTRANILRETELESITINVKPEAHASPPTVDTPLQAPTETSHPLGEWPQSIVRLLAVSLAFNVGAILLGIALYFRRRGQRQRRPQRSIDLQSQGDQEREAFKAVLNCPDDEPAQLRQAILHWARLYWLQCEILSLTQLFEIADEPDLKEHFTNLDHSLYGRNPGAKVDVPSIKKLLRQIHQRKISNKGCSPALKPLYPQG